MLTSRKLETTELSTSPRGMFLMDRKNRNISESAQISFRDFCWAKKGRETPRMGSGWAHFRSRSIQLVIPLGGALSQVLVQESWRLGLCFPTCVQSDRINSVLLRALPDNCMSLCTLAETQGLYSIGNHLLGESGERADENRRLATHHCFHRYSR